MAMWSPAMADPVRRDKDLTTLADTSRRSAGPINSFLHLVDSQVIFMEIEYPFIEYFL